MSTLIKLLDPKGKKLFSVKNHIADVCRSFTVIYSKQGFSTYRILDKIESQEIDHKRIRINYSSGASLLIRP